MRRLERLLALSEKTAEDLRARGEAITGEICLALRGGGGNTAVLTRAMAAFRRCHPQVRFSLPDCDAAASVRLDPVLRYGQAAWAAALVRAGAGAALCPDGEDWGAELRFVPLEPPLERETALIWRKDRLHAPACETFLQWLRQSLTRGASV